MAKLRDGTIVQGNETVNGNLNVTGVISGATLNTGHGANELYPMDQSVKTTDNVKFASVNTGHGANELYPMDQSVKKADNVTFNNLTAKGKLDVTGAITGATINTGPGVTEVHLMNQNLRTTDSPTFSALGFASLNPGNSTETSVQLDGGASQVLPKGAYAIKLDHVNLTIEMKYGSDWDTIFDSLGGFVISDGVNFRLRNKGPAGPLIVSMRKW